MPKVEGVEFIQKIKAYEKSKGFQSTPIIILSGNITGENVTKAREAGVKYALTKPCSTDDFTGKIIEVLKKYHPEKIEVT